MLDVITETSLVDELPGNLCGINHMFLKGLLLRTQAIHSLDSLRKGTVINWTGLEFAGV